MKRTVVDGKWAGTWEFGPDGKPLPWCCHYIMTAGMISFCGDCTHSLAGKIVPIPELPLGYRD
jgi:hypothetical protein